MLNIMNIMELAKIFVLCVCVCAVVDAGRNLKGRRRRDECVLFKANATYAMYTGETYIDIGAHYAIAGDVNITFQVFPDRYCHDGVLFSVGTEKFEYYEWKTKAVKTQFFVIEFYFSAISMLMKALKTEYMSPFEIFRTFPDSYFLAAAQWVTIKAIRTGGIWTLQLDDIVRTMPVNRQNNVQIRDTNIYIGGKPDQYRLQFRGILKNLRINQEKVTFRGKPSKGLVEIWHCSAPEVTNFMQEIINQEEPSIYLPRPINEPED